MAAPTPAENQLAGKGHDMCDSDDEQLFAELENDEALVQLQNARMEQLVRDAQRSREASIKGYGELTDIKEEKNFFDLTTTVDRCVIHFYKDDFRMCSIADGHLKKIAERHHETKFAKINVKIANFCVDKLKIKMLPAIICFKKGIVRDRILGFTDFGDNENFPTEALERRLALAGVIDIEDDKLGKTKTIYGFDKSRNPDDSSSDEGF